MKLRDLVEKDIIFLADIEELYYDGKRCHWKDFENFLDYEVDYISPCTNESLEIGVK